MNSDSNNRKQEQRVCGHQCTFQHIVPRFIIAHWANPYKPDSSRNHDKIYYMNHTGIHRAKSGSEAFCGKLIYSDDLDDSWKQVESSMSYLLPRLLEDDTSITIGELTGCIRPYMASTVARSATLTEKLTTTPLEESTHWTGIDIMRSLTMETMMTALAYADITIASGDGELALPGDGYVFLEPKGGAPTMIAPISPDMALKATWRHRASSRTADKTLSVDADRIDAGVERMLCMAGLAGGMQYVAARTRDELCTLQDQYESMPAHAGGRRNILSWVLSWLPLNRIRDWAKIAVEPLPAGRRITAHNPNEYWGSRHLLKNASRTGGWLEPAVIIPARTSTLKLSDRPALGIMNTKQDAGNDRLATRIRWKAMSMETGEDGQIREY